MVAPGGRPASTRRGQRVHGAALVRAPSASSPAGLPGPTAARWRLYVPVSRFVGWPATIIAEPLNSHHRQTRPTALSLSEIRAQGVVIPGGMPAATSGARTTRHQDERPLLALVRAPGPAHPLPQCQSWVACPHPPNRCEIRFGSCLKRPPCPAASLRNRTARLGTWETDGLADKTRSLREQPSK